MQRPRKQKTPIVNQELLNLYVQQLHLKQENLAGDVGCGVPVIRKFMQSGCGSGFHAQLIDKALEKAFNEHSHLGKLGTPYRTIFLSPDQATNAAQPANTRVHERVEVRTDAHSPETGNTRPTDVDAAQLSLSRADGVDVGTYRFFPPGIDDAVAELRRHALDKIKSGEEVVIRWLGVTMRYGAYHLSDLAAIPAQTPVKLELAMLDPAWQELPKLHPDWPKEADGGYTTLLGFLERERVKFQSRISGKLFVYQERPHIHGFAINNRFYYVSWANYDEHDVFHIVGNQGYDFFELGKGPRDDTRIALFNSWFDHFCRQGEQRFPPPLRQSQSDHMPKVEAALTLESFLRGCKKETFLNTLSSDWLNQLLPGISLLLGCGQGTEHHCEGDAAIHTWMVLDELRRVCRHDLRREPDFIELFGALIHDWKKPAARKIDPDGSITFPGHEEMAAAEVEGVAAALQLQKEEKEKLFYLVAYHGDATTFPSLPIEKQRALQESPYVDSLCALQKADAISAHSAKGGHWPVYWSQIKSEH